MVAQYFLGVRSITHYLFRSLTIDREGDLSRVLLLRRVVGPGPLSLSLGDAPERETKLLLTPSSSLPVLYTDLCVHARFPILEPTAMKDARKKVAEMTDQARFLNEPDPLRPTQQPTYPVHRPILSTNLCVHARLPILEPTAMKDARIKTAAITTKARFFNEPTAQFVVVSKNTTRMVFWGCWSWSWSCICLLFLFLNCDLVFCFCPVSLLLLVS